MKTFVVIAAGAADRPLEELGGRTPLEAAATPVLDGLAREGRVGRVGTLPDGAAPGGVAFPLGIYGLDPAVYGDIGACLDAAAYEVPVGSLDQVFRLSLVTADDDTIFDPTAGFISRDETLLLLESLTESLADPNLAFHTGDGWRNVLLWKGARDVRVRTAPPFEVVGKSVSSALPRGTGIGRLLAAMERSVELLRVHEVNELRRDLGENPATRIWPWAPGVSLPLPGFEARTGVRAIAIGANPAFVGAARLQGIPTVRPTGATGRPGTNLRAKAQAALEAIEEHELVLLHVDALAAASHARDFVAKVETLERFDGYVIGVLARAIKAGLEARLVVIGGEPVSVQTGRTLADPAPFCLHGPGVRSHRGGPFTEVAARSAGFEVEQAHELMDFVLHLGGS